MKATDALLSEPRGLAFDAAGNLYLAEWGRVRRINTSGRITTVAATSTPTGDGGSPTASWANPADVAFDEDGNLLVADSGGHRIWKMTPAGAVSTIAGNGGFSPIVDGGPATESALPYPRTVAVHDGSIYVNGLNGFSVRKIDHSGTMTTVAGTGLPGDAGDGGPALTTPLRAYGLDVDADGNLHIADPVNNRLVRLDRQGMITTTAGNGTYAHGGDGGPATRAMFGGLLRFAFDADGDLFVADIANDAVRRIDAAGIVTTVVKVDFASVGAVAFDHAGRLYIAESGKSRVVRLEPSGDLTVVAGGRYGPAPGHPEELGDGGPATEAAMHWPSALAFDASGNLLIIDYDHLLSSGQDRLRKVDMTTGIITTVLRVGPPDPSAAPRCEGGGDMEFASNGDLLIAVGGFVRMSPAGAITHIAGGVGQNGFPLGDGGPASDASMDCPGGVTSDTAGTIYLSDPRHRRIRKIDHSGTISTVAGGGTQLDGDGGPATSDAGLLADVADVALDATGRMYFGSTVGRIGRIRRVDLPSIPVPTFHPLSPTRILDTRTGQGAPAAKVGPGATLRLQVTGTGGVPASGISAVAMNVTVTEPTATSYLTASPAGETRPLAANAVYGPGQTVSNLVIVKVGADGKVDLFNLAGSAHVVADVAGWFSG